MVSTWTNDMSALNICSPMDNVTLLFLLRASCLKNHSIDHLFLERIYSGYRWHAAEKVGCDKASREWYIREPIENIAKIPAKPL